MGENVSLLIMCYVIRTIRTLFLLKIFIPASYLLPVRLSSERQIHPRLSWSHGTQYWGTDTWWVMSYGAIKSEKWSVQMWNVVARPCMNATVAQLAVTEEYSQCRPKSKTIVWLYNTQWFNGSFAAVKWIYWPYVTPFNVLVVALITEGQLNAW